MRFLVERWTPQEFESNHYWSRGIVRDRERERGREVELRTHQLDFPACVWAVRRKEFVLMVWAEPHFGGWESLDELPRDSCVLLKFESHKLVEELRYRLDCGWVIVREEKEGLVLVSPSKLKAFREKTRQRNKSLLRFFSWV